MEAWFPPASNDEIITLLLLVKITDVIFRVNRESLRSNVNKYGRNLVPRAICFRSAKMALASAGHMALKPPVFGVFKYYNLYV
jgi:hypothetical protein